MSDYKRTRDVIRVVEERMASPCMQDPLQQGACRSIWWAINELPSADVVERKKHEKLLDEIYKRAKAEEVEVVRCRECKYWDNEQYGYCNMLDMNCEENDYCSWGERKDNE